MARSIWGGSISFGLVNIPVKLYPAIRSKQVHFHLLHDKDKVRVRQKLVCPAEHNKEVPREDTVRGFELSPERLVVVEPGELEALAPKASRTIEIVDFVDLASIDSLFFNQPYYALPDERSAKPYRLFLEAMRRTKKVGLGTFVMREKQYLAALRPLENLVCLETMYYADEVVRREGLEGAGAAAEAKVGERELKMAEQLIRSLSTGFKPQKYHDEYREAVRDLIEKKARGKHVVAQAHQQKKPQVIDLMSALKASVEESKKTKKRKVA
ncbi:MAG TPA: Ku protein [Candidatus Eisenbacteria bacterium]|nr:Ku protein [Candidatus Eisenbacteria bacterium]